MTIDPNIPTIQSLSTSIEHLQSTLTTPTSRRAVNEALNQIATAFETLKNDPKNKAELAQLATKVTLLTTYFENAPELPLTTRDKIFSVFRIFASLLYKSTPQPRMLQNDHSTRNNFNRVQNLANELSKPQVDSKKSSTNSAIGKNPQRTTRHLNAQTNPLIIEEKSTAITPVTVALTGPSAAQKAQILKTQNQYGPGKKPVTQTSTETPATPSTSQPAPEKPQTTNTKPPVENKAHLSSTSPNTPSTSPVLDQIRKLPSHEQKILQTKTDLLTNPNMTAAQKNTILILVYQYEPSIDICNAAKELIKPSMETDIIEGILHAVQDLAPRHNSTTLSNICKSASSFITDNAPKDRILPFLNAVAAIPLHARPAIWKEISTKIESNPSLELDDIATMLEASKPEIKTKTTIDWKSLKLPDLIDVPKDSTEQDKTKITSLNNLISRAQDTKQSTSPLKFFPGEKPETTYRKNALLTAPDKNLNKPWAAAAELLNTFNNAMHDQI